MNISPLKYTKPIPVINIRIINTVILFESDFSDFNKKYTIYTHPKTKPNSVDLESEIRIKYTPPIIIKALKSFINLFLYILIKAVERKTPININTAKSFGLFCIAQGNFLFI